MQDELQHGRLREVVLSRAFSSLFGKLLLVYFRELLMRRKPNTILPRMDSHDPVGALSVMVPKRPLVQAYPVGKVLETAFHGAVSMNLTLRRRFRIKPLIPPWMIGPTAVAFLSCLRAAVLMPQLQTGFPRFVICARLRYHL